ncbi:glycoside hydrolase [Corynascus novoguineensis]|uniref:Glycoside hydrolase n=1 Tax=Corynascus novoguineensis TaxID=1126955 RepID=A0AAN7CKI5_9PEZI|nr:glycoside hydrolase [Corynascus novoguineensis]
MRRLSLSLQSLLAISALVTGIAASADPAQGSDGSNLTKPHKVVTVVVTETVTTCPNRPTVCSNSATVTASSTLTSSGSSSSASASSSSSSSSVTRSSTSSAAVPECTDFWLEKIKHQGVAPFGGSDYEVFRNVKDYGAKGDGVSDDTEAINRAISDGKRCGPGCTGSTKKPGLIYFPPGTYMVSSPIIDFYYTQLIGNPGCMPVLKATSDFDGRFLLDTNPYGENGLAWGATNVFWRQVANLVIDTTEVSPKKLISGIHWPSSQATSLSNIVFRASAAEGTQHQGLFIEEGSGGFMGDLVFYGGAQAMSIGNQQFTMRNITVHNAKTAIEQLWSWGWTYQGVSINDCEVGFDFTAADQGDLKVGSITILDSEIKNTPVGIKYGDPDATTPDVPNNFIFENLRLDNVPTAIRGPSGTVLPGTSGKSVIEGWGRGHAYTPASGPETFEGPITPNKRPASLVAGDGFYHRSKPQYEDVPLSEFVSARAAGAKGDGSTDDTDALNDLFESAAAAGKIVFLDAGMYVVTKTVRIPPGSRIVGEAFPVILSSGKFFSSASSPQPVVQVGARGGETGRIEWSNTIVSTRGAQAGAILIEYNLASSGSSPSGLWDVHVRVGGFAGSELQLPQCAKTPDTPINADNPPPAECISGFLSVHITPSASGVYMENCWVWVADHDIEEGANNQQISIFAGRGLLIEGAAGPIWLVGSSVEHHQLYEYQLIEATDVWMGQIQTESAYYQPNPDATLPFPALEKYHDPVFAEGESGWGLRVVDSTGVLVYGAGLYSFFDNYDVNCSQIGEGARCQKRIFSVEGDATDLRLYNLNTVGTNKMITVDGVDVANYDDNIDGFVHSIALFGTDA